MMNIDIQEVKEDMTNSKISERTIFIVDYPKN